MLDRFLLQGPQNARFTILLAHGAGALGSRTIGVTGVGGMLFGTVIGVIAIPGLYYLFGKLSDGRKLLRDETLAPLSEETDALIEPSVASTATR